MVALTIAICAAVLVVLAIAGIRALRRANSQIETIMREELDRPDGEE